MRTLGLIGGMSWVSTAEYYRLANEAVAQRLGGLHSAKIVMESVDFAEIEALKLNEQWDAIGARLATSARRVEQAGAEVVVLCTNTMHRVAESIESALSVPFIHLADTTAEAISESGVARVGMLGTAFTMEQAFYVDRIRAHGIDVVIPDADDRARLSAIIYDELCRGVISPDSRKFYLEVAQRLRDAGAEGIILGCTEIELLISADDLEVPSFPTSTLHIEAAVAAMLR